MKQTAATSNLKEIKFSGVSQLVSMLPYFISLSFNLGLLIDTEKIFKSTRKIQLWEGGRSRQSVQLHKKFIIWLIWEFTCYQVETRHKNIFLSPSHETFKQSHAHWCHPLRSSRYYWKLNIELGRILKTMTRSIGLYLSECIASQPQQNVTIKMFRRPHHVWNSPSVSVQPSKRFLIKSLARALWIAVTWQKYSFLKRFILFAQFMCPLDVSKYQFVGRTGHLRWASTLLSRCAVMVPVE